MTIIAFIIAYLVGSISSAIIICKIMGLPDPRTQGSRNPGATNVLRLGGKLPALLTLLGDVLKGTIPVLLAKWYGFPLQAAALVAFGAFLGHLYPIFFQFEGGKGVATALGGFLALAPLPGLCWIVTWLIIIGFFGYASLASLFTSILAPFYLWFFTRNLPATLIIALMSILIILRHYENIINLIKGKEKKIISFKK